MRLDKYLAETAQCTRSEAKALLAKGRVTVNGAVCKKGDTQLKEADAVAVDGKALAYRQFVYLMLNNSILHLMTDRNEKTTNASKSLLYIRNCNKHLLQLLHHPPISKK